MLSAMLAYDAAGNVVATMDYAVAKDAQGQVIGLVDFEYYELAGQLDKVWIQPSQAVGSGTWPEWLGSRAHEFRVQLGADGRIAALIHRQSQHRRDRSAIVAAAAARVAAPGPFGVDLRDVLGGPTAPLRLDQAGRTLGRGAPLMAGG